MQALNFIPSKVVPMYLVWEVDDYGFVHVEVLKT